jgi:hypothetical protein
MTGTPRTVLRVVAWVATGVLAGGLVAGVGFAYADHGSTPSASTTTATDDLLSQVGLDAADPTTPAPDTSSAPGRQKLRGLLKNRMLGKRVAGLAGRMLHGELTVQTKDGVQTFLVQRGTVTAVGSGSVTVRSSDGFTRTWKVDASTKFGKAGATSIGANNKGDLVGVVGLASEHPTAKALRTRTPGGAAPGPKNDAPSTGGSPSGSASSGTAGSTSGSTESSGTVAS